MLVYGVCNIIVRNRAFFYLCSKIHRFWVNFMHMQVLQKERSITRENCHNLKENMLKYMNNSIRAYLNLTAQKLKMLSELQLNFLKTVSSHFKEYCSMFRVQCFKRFWYFFELVAQFGGILIDLYRVYRIPRPPPPSLQGLEDF